MIQTNIKNLYRYKNINKNLDTAINFISNNDFKKLSDGKYEIDSDNVFLNIATNETKDITECGFEAHRNYADIQLIIAGAEAIGYTDIENAISYDEYIEDRDFQSFYAEVSSICKLKENELIIVFPEDLHMPGIKNVERISRKAVLKVKL